MAISKFDRFIKMLNTGLLTLAIFMIEKVIVRLDTINTAINKQEIKNLGYEASLSAHADLIYKGQVKTSEVENRVTKTEKNDVFLLAHFGLIYIP